MGAWFRRKEVDSAAAVLHCVSRTMLQCASCLLGFPFRKVMQKH